MERTWTRTPSPSKYWLTLTESACVARIANPVPRSFAGDRGARGGQDWLVGSIGRAEGGTEGGSHIIVAYAVETVVVLCATDSPCSSTGSGTRWYMARLLTYLLWYSAGPGLGEGSDVIAVLSSSSVSRICMHMTYFVWWSWWEKGTHVVLGGLSVPRPNGRSSRRLLPYSIASVRVQ